MGISYPQAWLIRLPVYPPSKKMLITRPPTLWKTNLVTYVLQRRNWKGYQECLRRIIHKSSIEENQSITALQVIRVKGK